MRFRIFALLLILFFIVQIVNIPVIKAEVSEIYMTESLNILENLPYQTGQKLTVEFTIKNFGGKIVVFDAITVNIKNKHDETINSQWFRSVCLYPEESYKYLGEFIIDEPGEYNLYACYKEKGMEWINNIRSINASLSNIQIEVEKNQNENFNTKELPDAYYENFYGPVKIIKDMPDNVIYELSENILPEGLYLSEDGYIFGVPIGIGEFSFKVKINNEEGVNIAENSFKISVLDNSNDLMNVNIRDNFALTSVPDENVFWDIKGHWAQDIIKRMNYLGIVKGFPDGLFYPDKFVTRAELSTMICNALYLKHDGASICEFTDIEYHWANEYIKTISRHYGFLEGESFEPDIPATREETTAVISSAAGFDNIDVNKAILNMVFNDAESIMYPLRELITVSYIKGIVKGYPDGSFGPKNNVTRAEACCMIENVFISGVLSDISSDIPLNTTLSSRSTRTSYKSKRDLRKQRLEYIFGTDANGNIMYYQSREEAEPNMVEIEIPVWDIDKTTYEKVSKTMKVTVNKKIEAETREIFDRIYNDPEKFPIHSIVGYAWRPPYGSDNRISEHNYGTAIDINWVENPQVINGSNITTGKWEPYVNPYSVTPDGSVVSIFKEYRWAWGGDAFGENNQDYMHFSYLGH